MVLLQGTVCDVTEALINFQELLHTVCMHSGTLYHDNLRWQEATSRMLFLSDHFAIIIVILAFVSALLICTRTCSVYLLYLPAFLYQTSKCLGIRHVLSLQAPSELRSLYVLMTSYIYRCIVVMFTIYYLCSSALLDCSGKHVFLPSPSVAMPLEKKAAPSPNTINSH